MVLAAKIWHLWQILRDYRAGRETVRAMPIRLWLDTSSRCNLRCPMCPNQRLAPGQRGLMSMDLFTKVIEEARHFVHDIYLHHRGEPLMNPAFFDMVRLARKYRVPTRFHSNGTLLDEERTEALLAAGPDLVSFSIDGFEKAAYESVRIGATFERTVGNVMRLLEKRREKNLRRPYVVIEKIRFAGRTETPEVRESALALRRQFLAAGADEVIEKAEYTWAEESAPAPGCDVCYTKCTFPWYSMVISWDGTVSPCPQDFHLVMKMGNVSTSLIAEVWNGDEYRKLRRALISDAASLSLCSKCDRLRRKTVGGLPLQYMVTFLVDHLVGYNALRRALGTAERN